MSTEAVENEERFDYGGSIIKAPQIECQYRNILILGQYRNIGGLKENRFTFRTAKRREFSTVRIWH